MLVGGTSGDRTPTAGSGRKFYVERGLRPQPVHRAWAKGTTMRYTSRPRRGKGRPGGAEDSFDDRAEIPIEPLRSMTLGADDSSSSGGRSRGRFEDGLSTDSGDLRDSGMWVRP